MMPKRIAHTLLLDAVAFFVLWQLNASAWVMFAAWLWSEASWIRGYTLPRRR